MYSKLPRKLGNMLHIKSEFNMLALKYKAINLAQGTPSIKTPQFLIDNMINAVKDGHNQYTNVLGHPDLRESISRHYSPKFKPAINRDLNPNTEILVTCGASSAWSSAVLNLWDHGEEVLTFEPFYPNYKSIVELSGAKLRTIPLKTSKVPKKNQIMFEYDWDAFEHALNPKTKVVMLTNPHNPTGQWLREEEIIRMTEILEKKAPQAFVVSDDIYDYLTFKSDYKIFANYGDNWKKTFTIYSGSKLMSVTGWKIGWIIAPEILTKEASLIHESGIFNLNVPGQVAMAKSMENLSKPYEGYESYFEYVSATFRKTRDEMIEVFLKSGIPLTPAVCEGGYYVLFDIKEAKSLIPNKFLKLGNYEDDNNTLVIQREFKTKIPLDYAFARWLCLNKGIAVMPGTSFCIEKPDMIDITKYSLRSELF